MLEHIDKLSGKTEGDSAERGERMSVLIKDMQMPKSCKTCALLQDYDGCMYCPFGDRPVFGDIEFVPNHVASDICPLVELPEKHGRLIDADALIDTLEQAIAIMEMMLKQLDLEDDDGCLMELKAYRDIRDGIKEIDAVIEAEGEKPYTTWHEVGEEHPVAYEIEAEGE